MMKRSYFLAIIIFAITGSAFQKKKKMATLDNAKAITNNLARIKEDLYAWKTETSNEQYQLFVNAMQKEFPKQWEQYAIDSTAWRGEAYYCEPFVEYYHKHPAYFEYPVVNVRYENAIAFCNWLTNNYHSDKNRKFNKVKFILPSKELWRYAASGGDTSRTYPWGTGFVRNKKGNYLSNFKKDEEEHINLHSGEKRFYTTSTKSFFPNSFGLYNCSGNVAEMLEQKYTAAGGGWHSPVYLTQINSILSYENPSPEIGFRVFMEVLEN